MTFEILSWRIYKYYFWHKSKNGWWGNSHKSLHLITGHHTLHVICAGWGIMGVATLHPAGTIHNKPKLFFFLIFTIQFSSKMQYIHCKRCTNLYTRQMEYWERMQWRSWKGFLRVVTSALPEVWTKILKKTTNFTFLFPLSAYIISNKTTAIRVLQFCHST